MPVRIERSPKPHITRTGPSVTLRLPGAKGDPGVATDASVAALVDNAASDTAASLNASYAGRRLVQPRKFVPATDFQPRAGVGSPSLTTTATFVAIPVWLLDSNTNEAIGVTLTDLPEAWDVVDVSAVWTVTAAGGTGDVVNLLAWYEQGVGEVAGARSGNRTAQRTVPGVAYEITETPMIQGLSVDPTKLLSLRLDRSATSGSDTATYDEAVLGLVVTPALTANLWAGGPRVDVDTVGYNAFPGLTTLTSGDLITSYRAGTSHQNDKGTINLRTSADDGATWSAVLSTVTDATYDVRDPKVTRLADGTLAMTYFLWNVGTQRWVTDGLKFVTSADDGATWSAPVNIDMGWDDYTAGCAPVVELANGDLLACGYGKNAAETWRTSKVARSTDGGATWTVLSTLADTGDSHHVESNLLDLGGGNVLATIRTEGGPQGAVIQTRHSTDSGATWGPLVEQFPGTGAPHTIKETSTGRVVVTYRDASMHAVRARSSADDGATWGAPLDVDDRSLYASCAQIADGLLRVVYASEDTSSHTFLRSRDIEVHA